MNRQLFAAALILAVLSGTVACDPDAVSPNAPNTKVSKANQGAKPAMVTTLVPQQAGFENQGCPVTVSSWSIASDAAGNLYIPDTERQAVLKIVPDGLTLVVAGGPASKLDGVAKDLRLSNQGGIVVAPDGTIYVATWFSILKITPDGVATTFAGADQPGSIDGTGGDARFNQPAGLALDMAGNLYVADEGNRAIRVVSPSRVVTTLVRGLEEHVSPVGQTTAFQSPCGVAVGPDGDLFVLDSGDSCVRKVSQQGVVTLLAGSTPGLIDGRGAIARFNKPSGLAYRPGRDLIVSDRLNGVVRQVALSGEVSTLAGGGVGVDDGSLLAARFYSLEGVAVDPSGTIYLLDGITDLNIRRISATAGVSTLRRKLGQPCGIAVSPLGEIYFVDNWANRLCKVSTDGRVETVAGSIFGGADGTGTAAQFALPLGVTFDPSGNGYVVDAFSVRKFTAQGQVKTLAGDKTGFADGTGADAKFAVVSGVAVGAGGLLYVTDQVNNAVRRCTADGVVTTFVGGSKGAADGVGKVAQFDAPRGLASDTDGTLYVADSGNNAIRKIALDGTVSTLAGGHKGSADGSGSAAQFNKPAGLAIDKAHNLYVADSDNHEIRKVTPAGAVTTIAGGRAGTADGSGGDAQFDRPTGLALDAAGDLLIADAGNGTIRRLALK